MSPSPRYGTFFNSPPALLAPETILLDLPNPPGVGSLAPFHMDLPKSFIFPPEPLEKSFIFSPEPLAKSFNLLPIVLFPPGFCPPISDTLPNRSLNLSPIPKNLRLLEVSFSKVLKSFKLGSVGLSLPKKSLTLPNIPPLVPFLLSVPVSVVPPPKLGIPLVCLPSPPGISIPNIPASPAIPAEPHPARPLPLGVLPPPLGAFLPVLPELPPLKPPLVSISEPFIIAIDLANDIAKATADAPNK